MSATRDFDLSPGRDFVNSPTRDRNKASTPIDRTPFNLSYAAGWQINAEVGNFLSSIYWLVQGQVFTMEGGDPAGINPVVSGLGLTTAEAPPRSGSLTPHNGFITDFFFNGGASATLDYTDLIPAGKFTIGLGCAGTPFTSGSVEFLANGSSLVSLGTFDASTSNRGAIVPITFDSVAHFGKNTKWKIQIKMTMGGSFAGYTWEVIQINPVTADTPYTALRSGAGFPLGEAEWGFPDEVIVGNVGLHGVGDPVGFPGCDVSFSLDKIIPP